LTNADLFDDSKPKKSHLPDYAKKKKRKLKGWHIASFIILLAIPLGLFGIPALENMSFELEPAPIDMSDKMILVKNMTSEEKPPDVEKHDFVGSEERITLTRDNKPIYRFVVATEGQWQGDFSDSIKKPITIKKEGYMEFQFNCFNESGVMKYFGNFRNLEGKSISVAVLKAKDIIAEQRVDINKAIIIEGNC